MQTSHQLADEAGSSLVVAWSPLSVILTCSVLTLGVGGGGDCGALSKSHSQHVPLPTVAWCAQMLHQHTAS
jgi:hypothetical protein